MSDNGMTPPSSPSSHNGSHNLTLTPSRKVQALLAQFSDSDSENERTNRNATASSRSNHRTVSPAPESDESEEDDRVQPHGRLAARLLGKQINPASHFGIQPGPVVVNETTKASSDLKHRETCDAPDDRFGASEDEIATGGRTRTRTSAGHNGDVDDSTHPVRSPSPLFFPSPSAARENTSPASTSYQRRKTSSPAGSKEKGRSKVSALVEKHRKARLAREAAEVAKRAVGVVDNEDEPLRRIRGSSPADDTSEGDASDDEDAVKRIQKQSRPTRKASKKALEEMNRETQRMSRNMQLAHQAKTKKKITKESLLSRFGFTSSNHLVDEQPAVTKNSTASSSAEASDAESGNIHFDTPPTSPLREIEDTTKEINEPEAKDITHLFDAGQFTDEVHGALVPGDGLSALVDPSNRQNLSMQMQWLVDYHENDITVKSPRFSKSGLLYNSAKPDEPRIKPTLKANIPRVSLARTILAQKDSESDSEIEIVKDRGSKRKYAAFETLPKRKAREKPSHLALRSLAHLIGNDDKKRSMNAAELESALRKKARLQANEERLNRIEELKAKGVVIQTVEERERDQQDVEDLVERARQEATEIQKREKALAKKDGTYVKDNLGDEDDDSEDEDFEDEAAASEHSVSEDGDDDDETDIVGEDTGEAGLIDEQADEAESNEEAEVSQEEDELSFEPELDPQTPASKFQQVRISRNARIISDDDDDDDDDGDDDKQEEDKISENQKHTITMITSPGLPHPAKTPLSIPRSVRKTIPGLQMSDDLPMGLSQAFAATMAESQASDMAGTQEQDSLDLVNSLPSPGFSHVPLLQRLDSVDLISESQPSASQTQPLNVDLVSQSQYVPESPRGLELGGTQRTPSRRHMPFDLTQDNGYIFSPFLGNRFAESPSLNAPHSTVETEILSKSVENSPIVQRRSRLQRGRAEVEEPDIDTNAPKTAFQIMSKAAKANADQNAYDKKNSDARKVIDEAAEESEDEYAGLGGASDDSGDDEENEDDRRMIDEDTQVGKGDEAKLAGLYADRERERDEKEVSKLLKDITTGALRRKRGVGDDLDLSDEEDAAARRREAKRREFARMRRELLKDEAVGKIAEDKKKEAFLRSIEDREAADEDDDDILDQPETTQPSESQSQPQGGGVLNSNSQDGVQAGQKRKLPLDPASESQMNRLPPALRRLNPALARKPATLAEIRESVSFLIEEPDSQAATVDLGLSDSEDDAEAYVDLNRHFREAEADENELDQDAEDLGDFIVEDDLPTKQNEQDGYFKKPDLPRQGRAPFNERRTKHADVVDRLSLLRQNSSTSSAPSSSVSSKMAFHAANSGVSFSGVTTLLRRATTNSSLGSMSGRENVSATGVVTNKTERGNATEEKEFIRKGNSGRRNAVNYQAERKTLREEKMSARSGALKANKSKKGNGFLGGLFRGDSWE